MCHRGAKDEGVLYNYILEQMDHPQFLKPAKFEKDPLESLSTDGARGLKLVLLFAIFLDLSPIGPPGS